MGMVSLVTRRIFGTQNERTLNGIRPIVEKVNALEPEIAGLSDDELRSKTDEFRGRLKKGETVDDLLPEAFAVVREAAKRTVKMRHFDVQILGGVVLHRGMISEMATGEGKTLVATLSVYLNALTGKGVHVITVNDYLAKRDSEWMGPVYEFLGLSVGVIQHDMESHERRKSYHCDITYGTNNEFGFDYLRDNMTLRAEDCVQKKLNYAVVDEVDSILIDEARTPLIISGPAEESTDKYYTIDKMVRRLTKGTDYEFSEKDHTVNLTEQGIQHAEELLSVENLYDDRNVGLVPHIEQALRAHSLFRRDKEYMIKDDKVMIVDEFTGRLMPGRRFSEGLHQALEAKEGVKIERENQTLATITFQNYFRMYEKLSGMTGTAETEAHEFHEIYKLGVVVIPTNRPLERANYPDMIYRTEREKFKAVGEEIIELHKEGRPVLVGTISIEKSEHLSRLLNRQAIPHSVLNARYHEKEAEIISRAGERGAVTIATNMAGRGTDIVLGEGIAKLGGLHVLGTERHESRRIDNQLRGRSGRQGDPGSSRFYLSLEDDLMRIFAPDWLANFMEKMGMEEGMPIEHKMITKSIETAQKRVETRNFEARKHLLEYDDVMNRQREIIYQERAHFLEGSEVRQRIEEMVDEVVEAGVTRYADPDLDRDNWDLKGVADWFHRSFGLEADSSQSEKADSREIFDRLVSQVKDALQKKEDTLGREKLHAFQQSVSLRVIDRRWMDHLYAMDSLREGIGLRAYGQRNPLIEYKQEGFQMFDEMLTRIKHQIVELIMKIRVVHDEEPRRDTMTSRRHYEHPQAQGISGLAPAESQGSVSQTQGGPVLPQRRRPVTRPRTFQREGLKVGRNDPCPCGSGKKYKKCHGS